MLLEKTTPPLAIPIHLNINTEPQAIYTVELHSFVGSPCITILPKQAKDTDPTTYQSRSNNDLLGSYHPTPQRSSPPCRKRLPLSQHHHHHQPYIHPSSTQYAYHAGSRLYQPSSSNSVVPIPSSAVQIYFNPNAATVASRGAACWMRGDSRKGRYPIYGVYVYVYVYVPKCGRHGFDPFGQ